MDASSTAPAGLPSFPVWVGSLRDSVKEAHLLNIFRKFGDVLSCHVMRDQATGRSRKFGYVNFSRVEDAEKAAKAMNGKELHGAAIKTKGPGRLRAEGHAKGAGSGRGVGRSKSSSAGVDYRPLTDCSFFMQGSKCTKGEKVSC